MVKLGIFSKTFPRPTLAETLDAVRLLGLDQVQLNAAPPENCRQEFDNRGMTLAILSATFNIIDPDPAARRQGVERFTRLAAGAKIAGAKMLSVCTGTRDAGDMWRQHPDNDSADSWREMVTAMAALAKIAEEHDVNIAFEPEQANVVNSAQKARALIDALQSKRVKVLIDAANLLTVENLPQQERVLKSAFELLGADIVVAHAKEFSQDGKLGDAVLGTGVVDFPLYTSLLRNLNKPIPLIMHGFGEEGAAQGARHMQSL